MDIFFFKTTGKKVGVIFVTGYLNIDSVAFLQLFYDIREFSGKLILPVSKLFQSVLWFVEWIVGDSSLSKLLFG